jgi:preprotein translocase subunit YajC
MTCSPGSFFQASASFLVAQAQPAPAAGKAAAPPAGRAADSAGGGFESLLFPLLIIFVVVFLMVMPQRKKEKQRRLMLDAIKKGDRIVTIGGIHGEVVQIADRTLILLVDPQRGTTLKMARSAVSRILAEGEEGAEPE